MPAAGASWRRLPRSAQSSPEQPRTDQNSPEQPRTAQNNPEQPKADQNSPEQLKATHSSPEQPRTVQNSPDQPRANHMVQKITLPEHPTCENLISVSASKPCCVQNVLGTGTTAKPTGPRRGATMQSPHLVDTQVITSD